VTEPTDAFYAHLGRAIATARQCAGLKQQDLAAAIGLSRPSIGNFEQGTQRPALHTLLAICAATNITIGDLINDGTARAFASHPAINAAQDRRTALRAIKIRAEMRKLDGMLESLIESIDDPDDEP